jgi:glyoxylase-like metal-dependent hydrolase (beta-lactamase superfamily II)
MGGVKIKSLFLGNSNAFLVASGDEVALIDAGLGNRSKRILEEANRLVSNFAGLKYIFITHAHYDHVGSVNGLKDGLKESGQPKIVAHEKEAENLRQGKSPVPAGTIWLSKQISWLGCMIFHHCIRFKGFEPDLLFSQRLKLKLGENEIECFHCPGHTEGSICIKIAGNIFAGDSFFHLLPGRIFPPFANDVKELYRSWQKVLQEKPTRIFPGHGKPFSAGLLRHCLGLRKTI